MTNGVELRELSNGDRLAVTLESGEEFTAMVTSHQYDAATDHADGWAYCNFEGGLWEQVNDRVDSEVLTLRQSYARRTGEADDIQVDGTVWPDGGEHPSEEITLGVAESVQKVEA